MEKIENKIYDEKVSIIIPVYNTEKYLARCLDSLITQTYENLEIICIDDGSTDHSLDILKFYEKKDNRIKIITQENKGPSTARNKGLAVATGKYISFVDSDDFVSYNGYEILTTVAEENELDLIMFGGNTFSAEKSVEWIDEILNTRYVYYKKCDGCDLAFREKSSRPFLWLHFIKREILIAPTVLRFDETMNIGEDQLFQLQYLPRVRSAMVIEDKIYNYRMERNGSLMQLYSSRKVKKVEAHLELIQKVTDVWKNEGYFEYSQDRLVTWIISFMYYSIVDFPVSFQYRYAKKILEFIEKNNFDTYLVAEYEQGLLKSLKEIAITKIDDFAEAELLKQKIADEKYQINETLKSRAFKLGRRFTSKEQRLNLLPYENI